MFVFLNTSDPYYRLRGKQKIKSKEGEQSLGLIETWDLNVPGHADKGCDIFIFLSQFFFTLSPSLYINLCFSLSSSLSHYLMIDCLSVSLSLSFFPFLGFVLNLELSGIHNSKQNWLEYFLFKFLPSFELNLECVEWV